MNSLNEKINGAEFTRHDTSVGKLDCGEFLLDSFIEFLNRHPILGAIHREFGSDQKLRILCYQLSEYPALIEAFKATVNSRDDFFDEALFGAWLCFLMAGRLNLSVGVTKALFIAALIQDIAAKGMAHLNVLSPIFSADAGSLNDNQHDNAYAVITSRFLDTVPRLPSEIKSLVRAQRERFDGSGLPDGKVEKQLSIPQQVLIVTNEAATLSKRNASTPFDLPKILPILKLNAAVYFKPVFGALIGVITFSGSTVSEVSPLAQSINISAVTEKQRQLKLRWPNLVKASAETMLLNDTPALAALTQTARRAWMLVTTAGVLSDDLLLGCSNQENEALHSDEMETWLELDLLLDELNAIILSFQQQLEEVIQDVSIDISEPKRELLIGLCGSMGEPLETFDLDEFTILNMCD